MFSDDPRSTADLLSAADAAFNAGRGAEAAALYGKVLQHEPRHAISLRRLAWIHEACGHVPAAIELLRRLIEVLPSDARVQQDLGLCFLRVGKLNDAIVSFRASTQLDPKYAAAFCNLGLALEDVGDTASALDALQQAHRLDPASGFIAYHFAAVQTLAGRLEIPPPVCPPQYLLQLFDGYADRFDSHLFEKLNYQGPALLAEIVEGAIAIAPKKPWDILDIGCGTGMTAVPFREAAGRVVGIDLSSRMLRHASTRALPNGRLIYDELIQADVIEALQARPASANLVLSADVFIYIGDLRPVFAAVWSALRAGGLFTFTVESNKGRQDYCLLPSRRYAHARSYIELLAKEFNFSCAAHRESVLRLGDDGLPLQGEVYLLQRII